MKRQGNRHRQFSERPRGALAEFLTALEEVFPAAKGKTKIFTRPDGRVIVNVFLPRQVRERMQLFDRMSEVGTRLLIETGHYIILSGR